MPGCLGGELLVKSVRGREGETSRVGEDHGFGSDAIVKPDEAPPWIFSPLIVLVLTRTSLAWRCRAILHMLASGHASSWRGIGGVTCPALTPCDCRLPAAM